MIFWSQAVKPSDLNLVDPVDNALDKRQAHWKKPRKIEEHHNNGGHRNHRNNVDKNQKKAFSKHEAGFFKKLFSSPKF